MTNKTLEERFFDKVHINTKTGCWNWTAFRDKCGYGMFRMNGSMPYAHRVSYEMTGKEIKQGNCVCHTCDTPDCVNPFHLFQGTHTQNMRDCKRKGRNHTTRCAGTLQWQAILTDHNVQLIREFIKRFPPNLSKRSPNYGSAVFISRWFGVKPSTISQIRAGKTWKHVK